MTKLKPVKRRIIYLDEKVQNGLLIGLVLLEILLIAGTLWMLYLQMSEVVDANLYRVNISGQPDIYLQLLKTAMAGVIVLIGINVLVLWFAAWLWARHVDSILKPFRELMGKVEALDFSEDAAMDIPHAVVELALAWRHTRRQDLLRLRHEIARLDELGDLTDPGQRVRARAMLAGIRELLPNW